MDIAVAEIDLDALRHNYGRVKQIAPGCPVVAVLKANAYGHGMLWVAEALADVADAFAVARLEEAMELRKAGFCQRILMLEGWFDAQDLPIIARQQIECVLHSPEQLQMLLAAKLKQPMKIWLKVDTGMHRLGVDPAQAVSYFHQLRASDNVDDDIVLVSHLACADDPSSERTQQQIAGLEAIRKQLACPISLANSAGVVAWPATHNGWLRPGIMLYGVSPMLDQTAADHGLLPVMTLKSSVIAVHPLKQGESVGYGKTWTATENTRIAVVAMGYGDGYPRHAKSGTPVLIGGKRYAVAGRVSMDMLMIDIGMENEVQPGDEVILWGKGLPAEEIAAHADTIAYELFCSMTRRVNFQVKR